MQGLVRGAVCLAVGGFFALSRAVVQAGGREFLAQRRGRGRIGLVGMFPAGRVEAATWSWPFSRAGDFVGKGCVQAARTRDVCPHRLPPRQDNLSEYHG